MATNSSKAADKSTDKADAKDQGAHLDDETVVDGVECEILTSIRYGREKMQVGEAADGRPIIKPHGKPQRLEAGDTETLTLDEAERYEAMGVVKILVSAKKREALRKALDDQRTAKRRRPAAEAPAE